MALILTTELVGECRGSVGSVTLKGVRGGVSVQRRSRGRVGASSALAGSQCVFADVVGLWRSLAPVDRAAWDRAAGGAGLGQALFQSVVMMRHGLGFGFDVTVPVPGPCEPVTGVTLVISAGAQTAIVSWNSISYSSTIVGCLWYAIFPSAGVVEPPGGWLGPFGPIGLGAGSVDVWTFVNSRTASFEVGRAVGVRMAVFYSEAGVRTGVAEARCVVEP